MQVLLAFLCIILLYGLPKVYENENWVTNFVDITGNQGFSSLNDDMFNMLIKCRNCTSTSPPLLIWFQGGPGCSSLFGAYMENGPYIFNRTKHYIYNVYSWNTVADIIYMDQPPGVGFSQMRNNQTYCYNLTCIGKYMYIFLVKFMELHPEYKGRNIYLAGQSYAGQYIPGVAGYLARAKNPNIKLKGAAIGNGIVNLLLQVGTYPIFGYENKVLNYTTFLRHQLDSYACETALNLKIESDYWLCFQAYMQIRKLLINSNNILEKESNRQIDT